MYNHFLLQMLSSLLQLRFSFLVKHRYHHSRLIDRYLQYLSSHLLIDKYSLRCLTMCRDSQKKFSRRLRNSHSYDFLSRHLMNSSFHDHSTMNRNLQIFHSLRRSIDSFSQTRNFMTRFRRKLTLYLMFSRFNLY